MVKILRLIAIVRELTAKYDKDEKFKRTCNSLEVSTQNLMTHLNTDDPEEIAKWLSNTIQDRINYESQDV